MPEWWPNVRLSCIPTLCQSKTDLAKRKQLWTVAAWFLKCIIPWRTSSHCGWGQDMGSFEAKNRRSSRGRRPLTRPDRYGPRASVDSRHCSHPRSWPCYRTTPTPVVSSRGRRPLTWPDRHGPRASAGKHSTDLSFLALV